ncbi:hypothetical protein ACHAXR_002610 [Thalassiosira sp. AJA248-18]
MATVQPDTATSNKSCTSGDEERPNDKIAPAAASNATRPNQNIICNSLLALAVFCVIAACLAVGLTRKPESVSLIRKPESIYDDALALLEATPLKMKEIPTTGETLSYREYNNGQPHTLVVLPGFRADDTMTSVIAAMPELQDHHIIAVNPRGWNGSTMNTPFTSHEELADEIMELLELMNVENSMAMGISTGGPIAFYMAQKYPEKIPVAFLAHSIPLSGLRFLTINNELVVLESIEAIKSSPAMPFEDPDFVYDLFKSFSTPGCNYIPKKHKLNQYFAKAAQNMPGAIDASVSNMRFNVTPIKTAFADSSDALSNLKSSKVVVIHGSKDTVSPWKIVEPLTKLAIAEQWAPPGTLSLYDDGLGHMGPVDSPYVFEKVYRQALEEQVLA